MSYSKAGAPIGALGFSRFVFRFALLASPSLLVNMVGGRAPNKDEIRELEDRIKEAIMEVAQKCNCDEATVRRKLNMGTFNSTNRTPSGWNLFVREYTGDTDEAERIAADILVDPAVIAPVEGTETTTSQGRKGNSPRHAPSCLCEC